MLTQTLSQEGGNQAKSSAIRENDNINVHITSAGGLIALALIHLKSNNEQIAKRLSVPETFHSLDYVRPAFLLQKILCRNLIMWDEIRNTEEWVIS